MGNIRPLMIFVPLPELRIYRRGMGDWVFPGHKIFIHLAKPILQVFFCTRIFKRVSALKWCIWWMCGNAWLDTSRPPLKLFSFLSHLWGYFQNYHMSSQTNFTAFLCAGVLMLPDLHKFVEVLIHWHLRPYIGQCIKIHKQSILSDQKQIKHLIYWF